MLSCRFSGPGTTPYNRRLASADRILQIVHQERHDNLPPLPLVPYAMAMSTTMIYRALRDGQREIVSACNDLRMCCDALNSLSRRWTVVRGVAKLANRLWKVLSVSFSAQQAADTNGQVPDQTPQADFVAVDAEGEMPKNDVDYAPARSAIGPAFFELDTAFNDLVSNAGMPSFFRPAMWDFWPVENGELGDVCPPPYQESPEQYHGLI